MKKNKKKYDNSNNCFNIFNDDNIPPCAAYLGSKNPYIVDGNIYFRNNNRLYFFLTFDTSPSSIVTYNPFDPSTYTFRSNGNMQIDIYYFLIGLFINEVEKGQVINYEDIQIHDDENADKFIKKLLGNKYEITNIFIPSLTYMISNSSAVIPLYYGKLEISPLNYYIILMLSRFCGNYAMLFSDNAYITNDFINNELANMYCKFPCM